MDSCFPFFFKLYVCVPAKIKWVGSGSMYMKGGGGGGKVGLIE